MLQAIYDEFRTGCWASEEDCLCHDSGWALSDVDTWHKCSIHFCGQLSPEACDSYSREDCTFDVEAFQAAYHMSLVEWAVERGRASFTREEAALRVSRPIPASSNDDIPF